MYSFCFEKNIKVLRGEIMFFKDKMIKEAVSKAEFEQKKKDEELYAKRLHEFDELNNEELKKVIQIHKKEIQKLINSNEAEAREKTKKYVRKVENVLFEKNSEIKKLQTYSKSVENENKKLREAVEILRPLHLEINNTLRRLNSFIVLVNNASLEMKQNIERTSYELEIKTFTYNKQARKIAELLGEIKTIEV
jgi:chromosome segregation ATPase